MRFFIWLFRAFIFFALFAFSLNNQHEASVKWFFGQEWRAPMVFIVLAAFGLGCAFGVIAMVPSWWKHWRLARRAQPAADVLSEHPAAAMPLRLEPGIVQPPRDGI